ncbi:MAG: DUF6009 family protein [Ktedonobacterales bacterium]
MPFFDPDDPDRYKMKNHHASDFDIADEEAVVWLEDSAKYPYLRETPSLLRGRRTSPGRGTYGIHIVAYATLKPLARGAANGSKFFHRRIWYYKDTSDFYPGGPIEAVVPTTIMAGEYADAYYWKWQIDHGYVEGGPLVPVPDPE